MKKIDITQIVSPNSKQPFTANSLNFLQKGNKEMISALCLNIISNHGLTYSGTVPYLITNVNLIFPLASDGAVFYAGELYIMLENTGLTYAYIDTTPDSVADPLLFTDGVSKNVHQNRYLNFTNTATGSLFTVANIVNLVTNNTSGNITPLNGYNTYHVAPSYKISNNRVFLNGNVSATPATGSVMFIVPAPSNEIRISCVTRNTTTLIVNQILIDTSGNASLVQPNGTTDIVYLDGLNYSL